MNNEDTDFNESSDEETAGTPDEGVPTERLPLGYWLRTVDGLITREFAAAFDGADIDRRDWMLLNALSGDVPLPAFAERFARKGKRLRGLAERGWVEETGDGTWVLTDEGRDAKERLGDDRGRHPFARRRRGLARRLRDHDGLARGDRPRTRMGRGRADAARLRLAAVASAPGFRPGIRSRFRPGLRSRFRTGLRPGLRSRCRFRSGLRPRTMTTMRTARATTLTARTPATRTTSTARTATVSTALTTTTVTADAVSARAGRPSARTSAASTPGSREGAPPSPRRAARPTRSDTVSAPSLIRGARSDNGSCPFVVPGVRPAPVRRAEWMRCRPPPCSRSRTARPRPRARPPSPRSSMPSQRACPACTCGSVTSTSSSPMWRHPSTLSPPTSRP